MFEIYKIKEGESIDSIANNYRVSSEYLVKLNGLDCDRAVKPGGNIIVPRLVSNYVDYYTVKDGSSLNDFASKNGIDYNLLGNLNGLNRYDYLYPNQVIVLPKKDVSFYITRDNDTLNGVSKIMKTNVGNLLRQNDKLYLKEGQLIVYKEK